MEYKGQWKNMRNDILSMSALFIFAACGVSIDASVTTIGDDSVVSETDAGSTAADASVNTRDAGSFNVYDAGTAVHDAGNTIYDAGPAVHDAGFDDDYEFISIPAGSFVVGRSSISYSSGDTVTLNAFSLGKTPVTVAEFEKCVAAEACTPAHYKTVSDDQFCNYNRGNDWKNHPMNCVDWDGAKEYCEWIGGRLPTEEEWEYAATHDGNQHLNIKYPWGDTSPVHCGTANYIYVDYSSSKCLYCYGKTETSSKVGTSAVGKYSPAGDSPLGLVDMAGNVWEWTASMYFSGGRIYIIKGGSWDNNDGYLPVYSFSHDHYREDKTDYCGFRCAK